MAVLKSKAALFDWYVGLKTNLQSKNYTTLSFEKEIIDTIVAFFEGKKEITPTKADLIADILNAVGYDHLFTKNWSVHLAYVLGESGATTNEVVNTALRNFTSVQVAGWKRKEEKEAVKPEEQKVFAKFPTKAELEQWVSIKKPAPRAGTEPFNMSLMKTGDQSTVSFFNDVEKYLASLKLELNRSDVNYVDNMLIMDYFISLISTMEIPEQSYQRLVEELTSLYADPVKTPYIDAFVERGARPLPTQQRQLTTAERAIKRAVSWREEETKTNHQQKDILQQFADCYCPVMMAKQHATQQLFEFVAGTVKRVLTAIAYPNNLADADLLAKGHTINVLNVKHGAIGVSTTIARNGLVKLRIFAEREPGDNQRGLSSMDALAHNHARQLPPMSMVSSMPALVDSFIKMWDIPNQVPRHMHNTVGGRSSDPYPLHQLDGLMMAIAQEAAEYGITPTYGTTEDSLIVVLH